MARHEHDSLAGLVEERRLLGAEKKNWPARSAEHDLTLSSDCWRVDEVLAYGALAHVAHPGSQAAGQLLSDLGSEGGRHVASPAASTGARAIGDCGRRGDHEQDKQDEQCKSRATHGWDGPLWNHANIVARGPQLNHLQLRHRAR